MILNGAILIPTLDNICTLDFFLIEHNTKHKTFTVAIYEPNNEVFLLGSWHIPWYMRNMRCDQFLENHKTQLYRFSSKNNLSVYLANKKIVYKNYKDWCTNILDILQFLVIPSYDICNYHYYIKSVYNDYYQELFTYLINSNAFVPPWLYDQKFVTYLTGQSDICINKQICNSFLAITMRKIIRKAHYKDNILTYQQILHINQFSLLDDEVEILISWSKYLGW